MNTHHLKTDLSCGSCVEKLKPILNSEKGIHHWNVDLKSPDKTLTVHGDLSEAEIGKLIGKEGYHILGHVKSNVESRSTKDTLDEKVTFKTFYPLYLIFSYIIGFTILKQTTSGSFNVHLAMRDFMGGFFVVFSFFKLLNLKGFVEGYSTYDVLAKRWPTYGYVYAFLELFLGAAYLANFQPVFTNIFTFVLMSFSSIGVIQNLMKKRKIQCACLGTVFKLPMTYITVTEDLLMAGMALVAVTY